MIKKFLPALIIIVSFAYIVFSFVDYYDVVDHQDDIRDDDEKLIKDSRAAKLYYFISRKKNYYTPDVLRNLQIEFLGEIDGYRIYLVEHKGDVILKDYNGMSVEEYRFPAGAETRIIGIMSGELYAFGNLAHETNINIDELYRLVINTRNRQHDCREGI